MHDNIHYVHQIPLNQHPQEQMGAGLSNIPDYWMVPYTQLFVTAPILGLHN